MILEEHEKQRFCAWLELEIETSKMFVKQMESMNFGAMTEQIQKPYKQRMAGCIIVLTLLRSLESQTIG